MAASNARSGAAAQSPPAQASGTQHASPRLRFVPLAIAALAMLLGLWTGFTRLGVDLPGGMPALAEFHAALMISGFLGTVISLERAVALGRGWAYGAPALSCLGALALIAGMTHLGAALFVIAAAVLLLASVAIVRRHLALFTVVLAVAAACWGAGSALWLMGATPPAVTGWWLNFLVLTIAAERLELSRLAHPPRSSQIAFAAIVLLLLAGSVRGELAGPSAWLTGAGLIACAAWLLHYDIARRTVFLTGQPRFSAYAILLGHGWLAIAGVLLLIAPPGASAFSYDAAVHAIAIGCVLSMIFGHAPIILPAITGVRVRYTGYLYLPLGLLHVAVALRVVGDMFAWLDLRAASGILTVLALALYAMTAVMAALRPKSYR
jgi:hypothetical protein